MITMGTTQHQQSVHGAAWLVMLDFAGGAQRFTTFSGTIASGGHDWLGLGSVVTVGSVTESEEVQADAINIGLSIVQTSLIALSLGNVQEYRGRRAEIYLQLLGSTYQPVGDAKRRWSGLMDRVEIQRQQGDDGATGVINLRCSRAGIGRMRHAQGLRLTNEQQQARFAGDTGLRYVRTLIEQPALWLSKEFQKR
jgi:hypothetical protein